MKGGHKRRAEGGRTEPPEPKAKEDERTKEMVEEEKKGHKFGGKVGEGLPRSISAGELVAGG